MWEKYICYGTPLRVGHATLGGESYISLGKVLRMGNPTSVGEITYGRVSY